MDDFHKAYLEGCKRSGLTNRYHIERSPLIKRDDPERLIVCCDRLSSQEWLPVFYALPLTKTLDWLINIQILTSNLSQKTQNYNFLLFSIQT